MPKPDFNKPTGHGVYFSGNFEIESIQVPSELGKKSGYRSYVVFINCGGADRKEETRYEIRAIGYSSPSMALEERKFYFLRGLFFPTNTVETHKDQFYFEGSDHAVIGPADDFKGDVVDTIGVTGLGIVSKLGTIVEECCIGLKDDNAVEDPKTLVVTVQHTDYHPGIKPAPTFYVKYRVHPLKYLSGIPRILKLGREAMFHGYLKDFNEETGCYIVIVNRVSTTCGHRDASEFTEKVAKTKNVTDNSGRPKPKKFIPKAVNAAFKSPVIPPPSTAGFESGPADHPTAPMSQSGSKTDGPVANEPAKKKRPAVTTPNKRARACPARRTSSSTTLDLTS
ncbi:uncharacterized protein MELLADRAFT_85870 [Melampsora larici-populina 98AG31]|uniref:Uncharacterized protein n=1 Tax=Melampsora larici-populina (strain 98AG31 / pathotype 3-4-7) TaxID=747676 RepID=F4SDG0_MELLP|nr:uncharacterized protein MELLADRAFT_85870 [Melampsora larici-populina 98AG31]EGF97319.1 hypothetical protein MELLADRAFT_85870 [Melampsora larici-populina 98AG31]